MKIQIENLNLEHEHIVIILVWFVGVLIINIFNYIRLANRKDLEQWKKREKMYGCSLFALTWPMSTILALFIISLVALPLLVTSVPSNFLFKDKE